MMKTVLTAICTGQHPQFLPTKNCIPKWLTKEARKDLGDDLTGEKGTGRRPIGKLEQ